MHLCNRLKKRVSYPVFGNWKCNRKFMEYECTRIIGESSPLYGLSIKVWACGAQGSGPVRVEEIKARSKNSIAVTPRAPSQA